MSGSILVAIAIGVAFIILCLGLYTLWKGGDVVATYFNRLMRIRFLAQFTAIIIMGVLYFSSQ